MLTFFQRLGFGLVLSVMAVIRLGAQEAPVFDAENLIAGTTNVFETNDGTISEIYLGPDGIWHKFLWRVDAGQSEARYMSVWTDQALRGLKIRIGERTIATFPNDCNHTLGVCINQLTTSWGVSGRTTNSTELVGDIWFRTTSVDAEGFGDLPRVYCSILDESGVAIAVYAVSFTGNVRWLRRTTNLNGIDSTDALARVTSLCQQRDLVS